MSIAEVIVREIQVEDIGPPKRKQVAQYLTEIQYLILLRLDSLLQGHLTNLGQVYVPGLMKSVLSLQTRT